MKRRGRIKELIQENEELKKRLQECERRIKEFEETAIEGARTAEEQIRKMYKEANEKFEERKKENERKGKEFRKILEKKGIDPNKFLTYVPATLQVKQRTFMGVIECVLGFLREFLYRLEDKKTIVGVILEFRDIEIVSEEPLRLKFIGEDLGGHVYHPWNWDFKDVSEALKNVGV